MSDDFLLLIEEKLVQVNRIGNLEMLQGLRDLYYLEPSVFQGLLEEPHLYQKELHKAITLFRQDCQVSPFLESNEGKYNFVLHIEELEFLRRCLSLEGAMQITKIQSNLDHRIVHYRLELLACLEKKRFYLQQIPSALKRLCTYTGIQSIQEALLLLNDFQTIEQQLLQHISKANNPNLKFAYKAFKPSPSLSNRDYLAQFQSGYSNFLLALLQVNLWSVGFYKGRIDSQFKSLSQSALKDWINLINSQQNKQYELHQFQQYELKDYYLLNVVDLLRLYKRQTASNVQNLETVIDNLNSKEQEQLEEQLSAETIEQLYTEQKEDLRLGRRVYLGIRNFFRRVGQGIRHFFKRLRKKIKEWKTILKTFLKKVFAQVARGLKMFLQGYRFLLGFRTIRTVDHRGKYIMTRFSFDFDSYSLAPLDIEQTALSLHQRKLRFHSQSLQLSMQLTGQIIRYILEWSKGPIGWLRLFVLLLKRVKKINSQFI